MAISGEPTGDQEATLAWARAVADGGATSIQLRAKKLKSGRLLALARAVVDAVSIPVIVNDRADVAILAGAAGVHLGADDVPVERVRSFAPDGFVIGTSVGNDEELANAREADYVGVGPVFGTGSKSDAGTAIGTGELARLIIEAGRPGIGVGGVTAENAALVIQAGAVGVAVLSAVAARPAAVARAIRSATGI
jgi:thiamine-phosphate pyrophosphorylase